MKKTPILDSNLKKIERLEKKNYLGEEKSYLLAIELLDIEDSVNSLSNLIPKLYSTPLSADNVENILNNIGEDLRHIAYHIKNSVYYNYLNE